VCGRFEGEGEHGVVGVVGVDADHDGPVGGGGGRDARRIRLVLVGRLLSGPHEDDGSVRVRDDGHAHGPDEEPADSAQPA
jgi:hypothetical protein